MSRRSKSFTPKTPPCRKTSTSPARAAAASPRAKQRFLKLWAKVESHCVRPAFRSGDNVVIRWNFAFTAADGQTRKMDELAYQRWQGDKIVEERFYYDPKQMTG